MQPALHDISFTDSPIIQPTWDHTSLVFSVVSQASFRISDRTRLGKTTLVIKNREVFVAQKYMANQNKTIALELPEEMETFDLIQETMVETDGTLHLNGWSKESGAWLMYTFKHFTCQIDAE